LTPARSVTIRASAIIAAGLLTIAGTAGVAAAAPSDGRTIYGVTSNGNRLVSFPANNPGAAHVVATPADATGMIIGLGPGETVVGIDFRPSSNVLYALTIGATTGTGNQLTGAGRVYIVDKATAVATRVTTAAAFTLSGAYFDIGFNPVSDALRIVSSNGQNLRLGNAAGTTDLSVLSTDTPLSYAGGDKNSAVSPRVAGIDYTPAAGSATTLYDIDYAVDALSVQGGVGGGTGAASPNGGVLSTVGSTGLGTNVTNLLGFDFERDGTGYASAQTTDPDTQGVSPGSTLFTVNTSAGTLTPIGAIGGDLLDSIAIDTTPGTPGAALPEFPVAALGPMAAFGMAGAVVVFRRRRSLAGS